MAQRFEYEFLVYTVSLLFDLMLRKFQRLRLAKMLSSTRVVGFLLSTATTCHSCLPS